MVIEDRPVECPMCGGSAVVVVAFPGHSGGVPEILSFECARHQPSREPVDDSLRQLITEG